MTATTHGKKMTWKSRIVLNDFTFFNWVVVLVILHCYFLLVYVHLNTTYTIWLLLILQSYYCLLIYARLSITSYQGSMKKIQVLHIENKQRKYYSIELLLSVDKKSIQSTVPFFHMSTTLNQV